MSFCHVLSLFIADCGLEGWCDGCNITNCFSTREDGCTAEFFNGLTVGSTATVSGMQCNTPESLLCGNDGSWTVEQTEGVYLAVNWHESPHLYSNHNNYYGISD